jgi:HTH-type transcriptional regulator/antitoxin HipB
MADMNAETDASAIGRALRDRRRELGLTQEELADLAAVSVRFLGDLERGKPTVRFDRLLAVARTLGLTITAG